MATNIYASAATIYSATPGAGVWIIDCRTTCDTAASTITIKVTVAGYTVQCGPTGYTKPSGTTSISLPVQVAAAAGEAVVVTIQSSNSSDTAVTLNTPTAVLIATNAVQIAGSAQVAPGAADGLVLGSAAYKLAVDSAGKVAVPDTQKVDVETIKARAITGSGSIAVGAFVGNATAAIAVDASGYVTYANTAPPSAATIAASVAAQAVGSVVGSIGKGIADILEDTASLFDGTRPDVNLGQLSCICSKEGAGALELINTADDSYGIRAAGIGPGGCGMSLSGVGEEGCGLRIIGYGETSRGLLVYGEDGASIGGSAGVGLSITGTQTALGEPITAEIATAVAVQTDIAALIGIQNGSSVITEAALANVGTSSDVADAICDEALSGHTTAGTLGKALSDILEDTGTTLPAAIPSASTVATAVWDAVLADHVDAGSTGKALSDAGSAGNPWSSATYATDGAAGAALAGILDDTGTSGVVVNAPATVGPFPAAALAAAPSGTVNAITWANNGSLTDGYVEVCQHAAAANPDGSALTFACVKADGTPINLDGKGLRMVVYGEHPNSSTMWQWSTNSEGLTISATSSHNIVELLSDNTHTGIAGSYRYSIWDSTNAASTSGVVVARGHFKILSERSSTS